MHSYYSYGTIFVYITTRRTHIRIPDRNNFEFVFGALKYSTHHHHRLQFIIPEIQIFRSEKRARENTRKNRKDYEEKAISRNDPLGCTFEQREIIRTLPC